jgi:hypothetical protein
VIKGERNLGDVGSSTRFGQSVSPSITKTCSNEWCHHMVITAASQRGRRVLCTDCRQEARQLKNARYYERVRERKIEASRQKYKDDPEYQALERSRKAAEERRYKDQTGMWRNTRRRQSFAG